MNKAFKIEDILTITTGITLCDGFGGVKQLSAFLHGDPDGAVYTITMSDLRAESARRLIQQHPQLPGESSTEHVSQANWREWLQEEKARLGDSLLIELGAPMEK